jgi:hypothetical protein
MCGIRIAQTREHVCDWISHGHVGLMPFLVLVSVTDQVIGTDL